MSLPFRLADDTANSIPDRRLGNEINVGVWVRLPALAFEDAAGLSAARVVARSRHGIAERHTLAELAIFLKGTVSEALLIAQLHAAEVQHTVLHGAGDPLPPARSHPLIQRRDNAEREMKSCSGVADLCGSHQWQPIAKTGGGGRTAHALGGILVDLVVLVRPRPKTLHGR